MTEAKPKSNATLFIIIALVAGAVLLVPCVLGGVAIVTGGLLLNRAADPGPPPVFVAPTPVMPAPVAKPAPPAEAPTP